MKTNTLKIRVGQVGDYEVFVNVIKNRESSEREFWIECAGFMKYVFGDYFTLYNTDAEAESWVRDLYSSGYFDCSLSSILRFVAEDEVLLEDV